MVRINGTSWGFTRVLGCSKAHATAIRVKNRRNLHSTVSFSTLTDEKAQWMTRISQLTIIAFPSMKCHVSDTGRCGDRTIERSETNTEKTSLAQSTFSSDSRSQVNCPLRNLPILLGTVKRILNRFSQIQWMRFSIVPNGNVTLISERLRESTRVIHPHSRCPHLYTHCGRTTVACSTDCVGRALN